MGSNNGKRPQIPSTTETLRRKRFDRLRTTMRSMTLRSLVKSNSQYYSASESTGNCSLVSPTITSSMREQQTTDEIYLSDFDYKKLSTLTGLQESKIDELHREFLILSQGGRINYHRFRAMLESIPFNRTQNELEKLARQTFLIFDKDGNNYLDFAEFIAAYITMEKNNNIGIGKENVNQPQTHQNKTEQWINRTPVVSTELSHTSYQPTRALISNPYRRDPETKLNNTLLTNHYVPFRPIVWNPLPITQQPQYVYR